jgi:hypothetical protein
MFSPGVSKFIDAVAFWYSYDASKTHPRAWSDAWQPSQSKKCSVKRTILGTRSVASDSATGASNPKSDVSGRFDLEQFARTELGIKT